MQPQQEYDLSMTSQPVPYMERTRLYYEAQGFEKPYVWAHFDEVPFTPLAKPLQESTLPLITTASLYDRAPTDVRVVASASSTTPPPRLYGNDLSWDKKTTHLDDRGSYLPIEYLTELVADGRIGALSKRFHCAPTEYSQKHTLEVDAPEILRRCRDFVDVDRSRCVVSQNKVGECSADIYTQSNHTSSPRSKFFLRPGPMLYAPS